MTHSETLTFIGRIKPGQGDFVLALDPEYAGALQGLSEFSHAIVLWWAHECDTAQDRARTVISRPYRNSPDDVGVFGSRSPSRPNPIGISTVGIASVDMQGGLVRTPFIDAEPDTPLLDIKPYFPASDRVRNARLPAWCRHWPDCLEASAAFDWEAEFN